ncbi:MAG TPA: glycosyltransferase family 4 protein [Miltoncostaeaceae bacterium]|nr:glycosyltransferase family 4 protein [Miltoncostaeaceae bacterium]
MGKGPPDRGGIAAFLSTLQASDLSSRHDLSLLNLTRDEVPRSGRLTASNVRRTLDDAVAVFRASRGVRVVHIHTALVPHVTLVRVTLLALAARARGARVIVHAHSGKVQRWLVSRPRRLLARAGLLPAHRIVAVSEDGRSALARATGRDVRLIENGVVCGAPPDDRPTSGAPRVLYAGVLTPRKGVVDLLEASRLLDGRGVRHEVVLAGGTPDEGPAAEEAVRSAAHKSPARFIGPQPHDEMDALFRSADVFCLPSWWEAMPLSVLEAMAAGAPVVATRVGDVARAVEDGVTGRLVTPRQPEELADALEPILRDSRLRTAMGRAGRERVERLFAMDATVDAIDGLYGELS